MKLLSDIDLEDIYFDVSNKNWNIKNDKDNLEFYSNEIFEIVFDPYTSDIKKQTELYVNIEHSELFVFLKKLENMYNNTINNAYSEKPEYNLSYKNLTQTLKLKIQTESVVCHDWNYNYIQYNRNTLKKGQKVKLGIKTYGPWFIDKENEYSDQINILYGLTFFVKHIQIIQ